MPTVKELRAQCKQNMMKGYYKMKKAELIQILGAKEQIEKVSHRMGIHAAKNGNMTKSIKELADKKYFCAVQIFTHGPRNQRRSKMDYKSVKEAAGSMNIYVHSSYPTNPWNGKMEIMVHTLDQFRASRELGSKGVVLHIPKITAEDTAATVKTLVKLLTEHSLMDGHKIILEMKAVKQHDTLSYESPEKINRLIERLKMLDVSSDNVCICIDTAHIYAGKAQIKTYAEAKLYLDALQYPEWIGLIHLNGNVYDSTKRSGDKHAIPLDHEDKIWKDIEYKHSGCKTFIEWATSKNIDCILEIKDHHTMEDVDKFLLKLA
jgi:endonuclease IV